MTPVTVAVDVSQVPAIANEAQTALSDARKIKIENQEQYSLAQEIRKKINSRIKELEEKRKSITAPLDEAKKNVMDLFRAPITAYTEAKDITDTLLIAYDQEQENKRREEQAKLEREAEKKRQEALQKAEAARAAGKEAQAEKYEQKAEQTVAPVIAATAAKVEGVSYRTIWRAEVVDFKTLPDEYKVVNQSALDKVAMAMKGALKIPGVEFKSEKVVASRR